MAMIASKGAVEGSDLGGSEEEVDCCAADERSVIEDDERRSVAEVTRPPTADEVDWSWEEAYMLEIVSGSRLHV